MLARLMAQHATEQPAVPGDGPCAGQRLAQQHGSGSVEPVARKQGENGKDRAGDELCKPRTGYLRNKAAAFQEREQGIDLKRAGGSQDDQQPGHDIVHRGHGVRAAVRMTEEGKAYRDQRNGHQHGACGVPVHGFLQDVGEPAMGLERSSNSVVQTKTAEQNEVLDFFSWWLLNFC